MKERNPIFWRHLGLTILAIAGLGIAGAWLDKEVHVEGERVRYVGDRTAFGKDGCEIENGDDGVVTGNGNIFEQERNLLANEVDFQGCVVMVVSDQLLEE